MSEEDFDTRKDDRETENYYTDETAIRAILQETFDPDFVDPAKKNQRNTLTHTGTRNTGAKGVLNDYRVAKEERKLQIERERLQAQESMRQTTLVLDPQEESDSFDLDSEDDEIFAAIREAKMKELEKLGSGEREGIVQTLQQEIRNQQISQKKV
eukprot:TRINITY_DN8691_c0_g1_i5.p1 TRINITY_DN8691_c0_g1~~TRINITY_DN8691_c0_g1_i5.p1  ORF type:complete len:155 (+),score=31.28 TRINITY_DN8691_c0_g1_i5:255-719(+)